MTASTGMAALSFLRAIGHDGKGLLELRLVREDRPVVRRFVDAPGQAAAVAVILAANAGGSSTLLFSVNSRCRPGGKDTDVAAVHAAVVDLDGKGLALEEQQRRVLALALLAPPVATVASGSVGHHHVYWHFLPSADPEKARAVVKRLRRWLASDPTEPPSRMMRLPGSLNWKDGTPKLIEIAYFAPSAAVSLQAISAALDRLGVPPLEELTEQERAARHASRRAAAPGVAPAARTVRLPAPAPSSPPPPRIVSGLHPDDWKALAEVLPPWGLRLIQQGHTDGDGYQSRSEADLSVVQLLVDAGATDQQIAAVFASTAIGAKYAEAGDSYLARTIDAARKSRQLSVVLIEKVKQWWLPYVRLYLQAVEGRHAGERFWGGIASGSSIWPYAFRAAGLQPAEAGARAAVCALEGRKAWVVLRGVTFAGKQRLEVARWQPQLKRTQ